MRAYHHTRDDFYKNPYGALPAGSALLLRLWTDSPCEAVLRAWDGEERLLPMEAMGAFEDGYLHELRLNLPELPCLFWYAFRIKCGEGDFLYGANQKQFGGEGSLYPGFDGPHFQITVYDEKYETPQWMKEGVMYQIFVDRFFMREDLRSRRQDIERHEVWDEMPFYQPEGRTQDNKARDFFGGNLKGIIDKLGYLRSLGVTVLYLNPIFQAASNHKYDVGDFKKVDPTFGDEKVFEALTKAARQYGMRVVLDSTFSHTGEDSLYFDRYGNYGGKGAYLDPKSPYRAWYNFTNYPEEYESWWGIPTLPETNELEPSYLDFTSRDEDSVCVYWPKLGSAGWRLDVADELPMEFLQLYRERLKQQDPDSVLIGEVWEDASHKVAYDQLRSYCLGDSLDSVMNYPLRDILIQYLKNERSAADAAEELSSLYENYSRPFAEALMNMLGSHDRARILNVLAGCEGEHLSKEEQRALRLSPEQRALGQARLYRMLVFTSLMPGIPCVYYGDEAGMEGARDPFNRAPFPWGKEDSAVTEMFRKILHMRRELPQLKGGDLRIFAFGDILVLRRQRGWNTLIAAIAPGARQLTLRAGDFGGDALMDLDGKIHRAKDGLLRLPIPEEGYAVFRND